MKNKGILLSLLVPLLLSACAPTYESFYVPYNYDLIADTNASTTPISLSASELRTMIESKQSFVLYYYSNNCSACKNSTELLNEYLSKNPIQIFKISAQEVYQNAGDNNPLEPFIFLFEVTPNIYFFNKGNLTATLPRNKYSSGYNVFESTLDSIMLRSRLFTTSKVEGAIKFFEENLEYFVFFSSYTDYKSEGSYISYSEEIYSDYVYPYMSTSEYSSLLVNYDDASADLLTYFETNFSISEIKYKNIALYKYRTNLIGDEYSSGIIYYDNEDGLNTLKDLITNHLLTKDYNL